MDVRRRRLAIPKKRLRKEEERTLIKVHFESVSEIYFFTLSRLRAFRNLVLVVADIYKAPIPSAASQIE